MTGQTIAGRATLHSSCRAPAAEPRPRVRRRTAEPGSVPEPGPGGGRSPVPGQRAPEQRAPEQPGRRAPRRRGRRRRGPERRAPEQRAPEQPGGGRLGGGGVGGGGLSGGGLSGGGLSGGRVARPGGRLGGGGARRPCGIRTTRVLVPGVRIAYVRARRGHVLLRRFPAPQAFRTAPGPRCRSAARSSAAWSRSRGSGLSVRYPPVRRSPLLRPPNPGAPASRPSAPRPSVITGPVPLG